MTNVFSSFIWPIKSHEIKKFSLLALLMFFILLNQNFIRCTKDSFIITTISSEVINYIKFWGEMPIGILFFFIYSKLCNHFTTEQIFRIILTFFLIFFIFFAFVIFPNQNFFYPASCQIDKYIESYYYLKWFIIMWGKWGLVLFYIMGELWPIIVFSLLFWQLSNKVVKTEEATRFYTLLTFFSNISLILSGYLINQYLTVFPYVFKNGYDDENLLKSLAIIILCIGIICLLLQFSIEKNFIKQDLKKSNNTNKSKVLKLNISDSIKMVFSSKYLGSIALLVIGYNAAANLIEGLWMSKVKELYPSNNAFMSYHGYVYIYTGIASLVFSLLGNMLLRTIGWFWSAMITPMIFLILGSIFFLSVITEKNLVILLGSVTAISPLFIIVFLGGVQNALGKAAKYSLFDSTKEMSYIPLSDEMKTKGKAAVDVVGAKLGKSTGGLVQITAFTISPGLTHPDIASLLLIIFFISGVVWMIGLNMLNIMYHKKFIE